jgi:hypothetical protein
LLTATSFSSSGTMEKVKIPTKVLLDAMMQQLGLPNAAYSTHKGRPAGLDATIHFYPCKHHLDNKLPMKSMSIHVFSNLEEAEDRLATEALKCMEDSYGTVLQDHSYNKLQLAQQKCRSLEHRQREKDVVIDYFSSSWCSTLNGNHTAAKELYRIIDDTFTGGSTSKDNNLN